MNKLPAAVCKCVIKKKTKKIKNEWSVVDQCTKCLTSMLYRLWVRVRQGNVNLEINKANLQSSLPCVPMAQVVRIPI